MEKFLDPTSTKNTKEQDSHATLDKRATNSLGVTFYRRWSFWGTYKYYLNCLRWVLYTTIFRMIFIAIATFLCNLISCSMMWVYFLKLLCVLWSLTILHTTKAIFPTSKQGMSHKQNWQLQENSSKAINLLTAIKVISVIKAIS